MISQDSVLTVTPIALGLKKDIEKECGNIIQGLNNAAISITGFNKDNAAIKLPEITNGGEHTLLMDYSVESLSKLIRHSVNSIQSHVLPICDVFENSIKEFCNDGNIEETILRNVGIEYIPFQYDIFDESFYPTDVDEKYGKAQISFNLDNFDLGKLPELSEEDIESLFAFTSNYKSVKEYFKDTSKIKRVIECFNTGKSRRCLFGVNGSEESIKLNNSLPLDMRDFPNFIIALFFVGKLHSEDAPLKGLTGITLEDYRQKLINLKGMLQTVLALYRNRTVNDNRRIIVNLSDNVSYKESTFNNGWKDIKLLSGDVTVLYDNSSLDFFSTSDKLNLSECVIGYMYGYFKNKPIHGSFIEIADSLQALYGEYSRNLIDKFNINQKKYVNKAVQSAIHDLANSEIFSELLEDIEPQIQHKANKISSALSKQGDVDAFFSTGEIINSIVNGNLKLSSTVFAVWIANVIGAPIAGEILSENINSHCGCVVEQRKQLTRSIVKLIIKRLYTK